MIKAVYVLNVMGTMSKDDSWYGWASKRLYTSKYNQNEIGTKSILEKSEAHREKASVQNSLVTSNKTKRVNHLTNSSAKSIISLSHISKGKSHSNETTGNSNEEVKEDPILSEKDLEGRTESVFGGVIKVLEEKEALDEILVPF